MNTVFKTQLTYAIKFYAVWTFTKALKGLGLRNVDISHSAPLDLTTTISPPGEFIAGLITHIHNEVIESRTGNRKTRKAKSLSKSCLVACPLDLRDLPQTEPLTQCQVSTFESLPPCTFFFCTFLLYLLLFSKLNFQLKAPMA